MELLKHDPIADDVLDAVAGHRQRAADEVVATVRVAKNAEAGVSRCSFERRLTDAGKVSGVAADGAHWLAEHLRGWGDVHAPTMARQRAALRDRGANEECCASVDLWRA